METAVALVIGGLITIAVALLVEWVKRPKLAVALGGRASAPNWDILHVRVINVPVAGLLGRLILRNDARGCRVSLAFQQHDMTGGRSLRLPPIPGRWSATPQPLSIVSAAGGGLQVIYDINRVPQTERFELQPDGYGEPIAVAIKHTGDSEAYAFSSRSYAAWAAQLDFRHGDYRLAMGKYDVEVTASVGGIKPTTKTFLLTCDSTGFLLTDPESDPS